MSAGVLMCSAINANALSTLSARYGMSIQSVIKGQSVKGSYWGDSEAGLHGNVLYVRDDTPAHSALHELCHYICMPASRRKQLDTNAGGDYQEENGVCYLQILLADQIAPMHRQRMMADMDAWGYTFRLGSAQHWFEHDAEDARAWLIYHRIITASGQPTWALRESESVGA